MWQRGRQGSGYEKLQIFALPFADAYLLRYPRGSHVPLHRDEVRKGRHFRLNIVVKRARSGGDFLCGHALLRFPRVVLFRPDLEEHAVTRIWAGTRYVLSFGWVLPQR